MRAVTLPVTDAVRVSRRDSPLPDLHADLLQPRLGAVEFDLGLVGQSALRLFQVLERPRACLVKAAHAIQDPARALHLVARLVVIRISLREVGRIDHGQRLALSRRDPPA